MEKKEQAPLPYSLDGQAFVGEGRGAPEVTVNQKKSDRKSKKKMEEK